MNPTITAAGETLSWDDLQERAETADTSTRYIPSGDTLDHLPTVLGLLRAGKSAVPLPSLLPPPLQKWIREETVDPGDSPPHVALLSSGSSGMPKLSATRPFFLDDDVLASTRSMMAGVLPQSVATTAPLSTSVVAYLAMLSLGVSVKVLPPRSPHSDFIALAADCEGVSIRPSYVEALSSRGLRVDDKVVMTSTAPLTSHTSALLADMGAQRVVDVYATTEAGLFAWRESDTDWFQVMPGITAREVDHELQVSGFTVLGHYTDGRYHSEPERLLGDTVYINGDKLMLIATTHTKAKVSGFSVPLEYVSAVAKKVAPGLESAETTVADGIVVLSYTGELPSDMPTRMRSELPWYAVPRRFNCEVEVSTRVARESWANC